MDYRMNLEKLIPLAQQADKTGNIEPLCDYVFHGSRFSRFETRQFAGLFTLLGVMAGRVAELETVVRQQALSIADKRGIAATLPPKQG
ncbi:MAG: hypothetical protein V1790_08790 [Planctomycetota bacterium]